MSAPEVAEALVAELNKGVHDMVILNFANGDMVGHTGVYEAIRKAVKTVDECVAKVVEAARANGYSVLITADHGNADHAVNEDGTPNTAHSLNVVPFIAVDDDVKTSKRHFIPRHHTAGAFLSGYSGYFFTRLHLFEKICVSSQPQRFLPGGLKGNRVRVPDSSRCCEFL